MAEKKVKLESLSLKAKKRKNFLIVGIILSILGFLAFSFINSMLKVDKSKIYEKAQIKKGDFEVIKNPEYKESWAISMENRIQNQNKRISELVDMVKNQQDIVISELKGFLNENNAKLEAKLNIFSEKTEKEVRELKKNMQKNLNEQDAKIKQLEDLVKTKLSEQDMAANTENGEDLIIGKDIEYKTDENGDKIIVKIGENQHETKSNGQNVDKNVSYSVKNPKLSEENKIEEIDMGEKKRSIVNEEKTAIKKEITPPKPKRAKLVTIGVDTSFNKKLIKKQIDIEKEVASKRDKKANTYHISTGYMTAYMLTGAVAPAFQEGSMEPLPVLFSVEGDILMSGDVTGDLDRCYLLGSAKGNMNSETADIKLVSLSCLVDNGKYRIEGPITGWVIGEDGTPGLKGEMLHKNGAWLARTFVSGFFETFSQALSGGSVTPISYGNTNGTTTNQNTGVSTSVNSNLLYAGAAGISNVFSKLGEYYLKMAEQIFPVIHVKAGRTVTILLIGGEDLQLVKNNVVKLSKMKEDKEREERRMKTDNLSVIKNAFTEVIANDKMSDSESSVEQLKGKGSDKGGAEGDVPPPPITEEPITEGDL